MLQDKPRHVGQLLRDRLSGAAADAVDGRRGDDGGQAGARGGVVGGEDELVDLAVEGGVGEGDEALDGGDVVVRLGREGGLAEARVGLVVPLEDAGAGEVDVVDGVVGFGYAFGDGFG